MRRPATQTEPAALGAPVAVSAPQGLPAWLVAVGLALGTLALYWPVTRCDFLNYDDVYNLTENVHVLNGLTWEGIKLYLLDPLEPPGWTPLTMWSHMAVCEVCGLNPWGHHLVNVLLHALNAALVFALLHQMTGAKWRSLWVAVFFAFHPTRVEAVAWVTQRREVLSAFFGLLALIAYARYAQAGMKNQEGRWKKEEAGDTQHATRNTGPPQIANRKSQITWYWVSWCCYVLGCMGKPMVMTWPFVMLLLDYWPLGRMQKAECRMQNAEAGDTDAPRDTLHVSRFTSHVSPTTLLRLLVEKIPFFAIVGSMVVGTLVVMASGGLLELGTRLPLGARLANALVSYCGYLGQMFWPTDLAVIYPLRDHYPLGQVVLAGGLLLGISTLVLVRLRRHPYLLVGWLWYCGTLLPVSQVVAISAQAISDRWSYIPSLGVLILVIWGAGELLQGKVEGRRQKEEGTTRNEQPGTRLHNSSFILHPSPHGTRVQSPIANRKSQIVLWAAGVAAMVLCWALTRQQIGYWQDSEALFRYTIEVTQGNYLAYNNLGSALDKKGQIDEAIRLYQQAVRIKPDFAQSRFNLGLALGQKGQSDEALAQLREGLRLKPNFYDGHYLLGLVLVQNGQLDEAIGQFREALRVNPDHADTHNDLGMALGRKGQMDEAILHLRVAVRLNPDHAGAHINLGVAFSQQGQIDEAIQQFQEALRLKPDAAAVHYNLGAALARRGQLDEAIRHDQEALRMEPNRAEVHNNLGSAFYQQGRTVEAIHQFQEALRLKPDFADARNNLVVALAARAAAPPPAGAATNR